MVYIWNCNVIQKTTKIQIFVLPQQLQQQQQLLFIKYSACNKLNSNNIYIAPTKPNTEIIIAIKI